MRIRGVIVLCGAIVLTGSVAAGVTTTVVDVPVAGATQRFLYLRPDAPRANIVAIPGGTGILGIQNDGSMTSVVATCFPVARTRQAFADRGFSVALVDATSTGAIYNFEDIQEVVRYMQARDNVPTWVIGGSSSTGTVATLAIHLSATDPVGALFFSPDSMPAAQAALIRRPTLVVYHLQDTNQFGAQLFNRLTSAPIKEVEKLTGGSSGGCATPYHLFEGLDDVFVATVASFIDRHNGSFAPPPPPAIASAVEFYHAEFDHYFVTHMANEIALLDAGTTIKGWTRTNQQFNVWPSAAAGSSPVCRYYIPPANGNSHFYGRGTVECNETAVKFPTFVNEDPDFFHVMLPDLGVCPASTRPVYRVFNNRAGDANHRYMIDRAIRDQMIARGWLAEGAGPDLVVMCSPQ